MCRNLQEAGIDISFDKLKEAFPGSVITRGHYARYLLEHGYIKSLPEAFERYVGDRCRYFVPREKVTPEQAVHLILVYFGLYLIYLIFYGLKLRKGHRRSYSPIRAYLT